MKIAVIGSKGLPPHQGGIEHQCAEIYPRMVAAGHQVDLYARSSYNAHSSHGKVDTYRGVRVITMPSIKVRGIDALACSGMSAALAATKNYDIIHFHALGPSLFTPVPQLFSGAKILTTCHGLDWQRAKWGTLSSKAIKTGEQAAVKFTDRLVVVSEALQEYFRQTYHKPSTYIENAPVAYADSDEQFAYGNSLGLERDRYLVFIGRLVPEKRVDLLLTAFQQLQQWQQDNGWKLVFVGDKSDTSSFSSQLLQLANNSPDIVFTGELQGPYLAEIMRGAGLFVLPSDLEGLPLALLEAMQEGIPAVVSDIPVHRQMMGQGRGITFAAGNLSALSSQLAWAIANPAEMALMAKQANAYVQSNHNWDNITQKYLQLYSTMLNRQLEPVFPTASSRIQTLRETRLKKQRY
ncbi:MAG: glycosyltransferase family 4 protein [Cyanobacteria bacterium J06598_3]